MPTDVAIRAPGQITCEQETDSHNQPAGWSRNDMKFMTNSSIK